ncbi:MAG: M48 family metalloprotease [Kiritimatiellae bacterium]|nr:M48 family metalloprotease [Kiritimatiellia bacterium]
MRQRASISRLDLPLSRRDFLRVGAAGAAGAVLTGCATNPVTQKTQFMLMTEAQEIEMDQQRRPHQFSSDWGAVQDDGLNQYIDTLGREIGARTHRPNLPYYFRVLNSPIHNAYTLGGGSCGVLRGLILEMDNEAQFAAVLGHEIGHMNLRHGAERMSKAILGQLIVAGIVGYVQAEHEKYAELAAGLGMLGAGALLAHYSREDEREADEWGMEYAVRAGQNPRGMVQAMDMLRKLDQHQPDLIARMFASHPMSEERYQTARGLVSSKYGALPDVPDNRERFMDNTAGIRRHKGAVQAMQQGVSCVMKKDYRGAAQQYDVALRQAPNDYAALLLTANLFLTVNEPAKAKPYVDQAHRVYPSEPMAQHLSGMIALRQGNFGNAHDAFVAYRQTLPGNPDTTFYVGYSLENMGRRQPAAQEYTNYLQAVTEGEFAQHAYTRLVEWGVVKPQTQQQ